MPDELSRAARLEAGGLLDAELTDEGILFRPRRGIDLSQAWFWTIPWQAGEREADEDVEAGWVEAVGSGDDLLDALRGGATQAPAKTTTKRPAPKS